MSRLKKVLLALFIILITLFAAVDVLVWWQWDNIAPIINGLRYSTAELEEKLAQNDQGIKDAVATIPEVVVRDITDEERQALRDGTLSPEELVQNIVAGEGEQTEPEPPKAPDSDTQPQPQQPQQPQRPAKTPEQLAYEQEISEIIAKVYVLREEFLGKLDALMAEALAEYRAMTPEQRSAGNLASFASSYLNKGLDMERECDARIEEIVAELETLLQENNGDLSIAQTVYDTYLEEKSLKKAWYMAELKKRGFV